MVHPYALGAIKPVRGTFEPNAGKHTRDLLIIRVMPVAVQLRIEELDGVENREYSAAQRR